ncbi:MAG TPA: UvrD-helicase domain-containing protein, partial [Burkholderiaceae bacterium]|nr:UvrD-helicase domain-containing protein [Burkholderiaceae bacterium]
MSQTLHPLTFPLSGSRLIEASAGTGKTYTIAALYLRLILCHGNEAAFSQPLLPPQILVMTFTEAATQELRDRIRARLVEAAAAFRNPDTPADALLASLREDFDPASWAECAWRLDTAAQWMDESAVMTLHAWCQRMLREHAFDSGSLFDLKVKTNHQGLYDQVIRDYWRTHCYTLSPDGAAWVHAHWRQPDVLWQRIKTFLLKMEVDLPADATCHEQPLQTWFDQQHDHVQTELSRLKQDARSWVADLFALLTEARDSKLFNAQGFNRKVQERAEQAFRSWLDDPAQVTLSLTPAHRKRLTVNGLKEIWNDPDSAPDTPALRGLEGLADQLEALQRQHDDALLWHAIGWTRQRFVTEKRQRAEMGFVDMLLDLRDVLRSASGTQLAETIRQRFPVAMVDEFQDTDPVQYEILDAVYDLADPAPHTALVLIGDPKQSIYGFRGADIHAYLRARRATQGRHYTLPVNYRSSAAMVAAVNHLFAQAEDRSQGQGAFLYRTMTSADADKSDNPIPFQPVDAHHVDLAWQQGGQRQPALTLWHGVAAHPTGAEDSASQDAATEGSSPDAAESCASAIVALLNDATASYTDMAGTAHGVAPGDIAVLVRDRHEARNIRQALSRRGVHSVYLSNADSVYQTQEAADMQLWLTACLHPQDERCLKSALAAPSLGLPLQTLQRYHHDEQRWEEAVLQFAAYGERWRTHGVLPMVHQLLHDYGLPGRLMQQPAGGERALTNILHLAEVLQQQARELDGQRALLQFLQQAG